ncbi:MAG: hypothetical protein H7332_13540 [Bdellovibrionales bacterium]|nr:hypothetical protein [Ramlibacter sp.]
MHPNVIDSAHLRYQAAQSLSKPIAAAVLSPRFLRRLKSLRGLSHEEVKQVFT